MVQYQTTAALVSIEDALNYLGRYFEHRFLAVPAGRTLPDIGDLGQNSFRSTTDEIKRHARERAFLTPRQVALEAASPRPRSTGTASDVADGLQLWFEQHAADGFIIQGGTPETFPRFVDEVVPLLQARGLFRRDYPHHRGKAWVWRYPLINSKNNKRESRYAENNTLAGRRVGI